MIWLTLRDLRWRARRVFLGVLATASVLAMTLLLGAVHDAFLAETDRTVAFFGGDAWVVPAGVAGPFTTNSPVPVDAGPDGGTPVAIFRHVVERPGGRTDVNVIAYRPEASSSPGRSTGVRPLRPARPPSTRPSAYAWGPRWCSADVPWSSSACCGGSPTTAERLPSS